MNVKVKRLPNLRDLPLPKYGTNNSSGRDLYAAIEGDKLVMRPFEIVKIPTGIALQLPFGYEAQVRGRSGLALKGLNVFWGTIDRDYISEVCVIAQNMSGQDFVIEFGNRIAQMIVAPVEHYEFSEVAELHETSRKGGFGSTGV